MSVEVALVVIVAFFFLPGFVFYCIINREFVKKKIHTMLEMAKKILSYLLAILVVALFVVFMLCMSFIPYEATTQEDIIRMQQRESMRYEQMKSGEWE